MATKFKKDQKVVLRSIIPNGPVQALRMDDDGNFFYRIDWQDIEGNEQSRWFAEDELEAV
jgi:hypothetical protein